MRSHFCLLGGAIAACALFPAAARADEDDTTQQNTPIVVTGTLTEDAPATRETLDAGTIATRVNAINVEDTLKYLPSLVVRKRHIGDTQAPLATRTSGLGSSARSLIYADGALLSALIGNNNTSASPRWGVVSTEEIERIDVLYGPYSAAYPGNSIGAVVNITTRLPEGLEASGNAALSLQDFDQYGTSDTYPAWQLGATIGDRIGALALFAAVDHVDSRSQPLSYVVASRPSGTSASGTAVSGGFDSTNRSGGPTRVLGATGLEHQRQDRIRLKAALDLAPGMRLTYSGALFRNRSDSHAETYLHASDGTPAYSGSLNIDGRLYSVAASSFSNGVNRVAQDHWSHSLSFDGASGAWRWQAIGTLYDIARDEQRVPGTALPAAASGGAGTITRLEGTGWKTLDLKARRQGGAHVVSFGAHGDWFALDSNRYATTDWIGGSEGALNLRSSGNTRTFALWAQDAWGFAPAWTLTLGGRQEWWRAYDGVNFSASPAISAVQPERSASRFSPKAALAWEATDGLMLRLSFGKAERFPTVGELYQIVTSPVPAVPDPTLRPERALSEELAAEWRDGNGSVRLALFNEDVKDALVSQTGPLNGTATLANFVQNVDATRVRGVEFAFDRRDLLPRFDLAGSVTYADSETREDAAFPAAIGKQLPSVPRWKASAVATWRPVEAVALTAAGRYSSRNWGTLDNSDPVGNVYQGFYQYLVFDLRAQIRVDRHLTLGLGVDNVTDDRYFLFHPFPGRSFVADLEVTL